MERGNMLRESCGCDFEWENCTNEKCQFGLVDLPEDLKVWVTAYKVTREFGGHEEGGWWFDRFEPIETVPCKNKYSAEIQEELSKEYEHMRHGRLDSVLGGTEIAVNIERERFEDATKERPIYE